jgi:ABC-type multidrug transport system fused ATPase/permease subunit
MLESDPLARAASLLRPRLPRILAAVALGVLSLGSALALAGVSAWLITRAWQMPPVLDLSVAVVAVRMFAISRGVLRYCERLATHDTALRAAGTARAQVYHRLAHGPAAAAVRLHSGELVTRVGADVDALADVLVRAVVPIGVAAVLAVAATAVIAVISPAAAAVLALCLLVAGVVAPAMAGRAAATQEALARQHRSERDTSAMIALEHAAELRVAGALPEVIGESQRRQHAWGAALDAANAHRGHRRQRAGRGCRRHRPGAHRRANHTGNSDVVAAVGIRGNDRPTGGRCPADTVADRRAPLARPGSAGRPGGIHEIYATTGRCRSVIGRRALRSPGFGASNSGDT